MSLATKLHEHVRACFTGLWVLTHEPDEALAEIANLCRTEDWSLAVWDIDRGLQVPGATVPDGPADPLAAVRTPMPSSGDSASLLVLTNFHRFLGNTELVQALQHRVLAGKQTRSVVIVLAPEVRLPAEIEKLFVVLQHDLPPREQLAEIARGVATEPGELPDGAALDRVLAAAAGLTRYEAEGAYSLSLVRHGTLEPETLWQLKSQTLLKSGLLSLHRGGGSLDALGGLLPLKTFCRRALRPQTTRPAGCRPKGVLLLGIPGTGKSAFCKALGAETGRPTLILDVGSLMGSLVGQTEERTRQALATAEAMAPCVLMIDELEKALGGVTTGAADSGVSARLFGSLLSWLSDHESDVFVVCTANDVSKLPPELARAERFDALFFLDLPGEAEKALIWSQYVSEFALDAGQKRPEDAGWTGAEIKSCCRLAALLDVPLVQAATHVVPVSATASETVERLRAWASGRCLSADKPGVYRRESANDAPRPRRRVGRGPSVN